MLKQMLTDCLKLNGAIGLTELVVIHDLIIHEFKSTTPGIGVDFGSHRGRSSMPAVLALKPYYPIMQKFYMVDLLYDLLNPEWKNTTQKGAENIPWGYTKEPNFAEDCKTNVSKYSIVPVYAVGRSSLQFLAENTNPINYAFIDSDDHQLELVMKEVRELMNKINIGGLVLFHDFKNQYHGPAEAHAAMIKTGKYENVPVNWEKIKSDVIKMNIASDDPNSWHWPQDKLYPTFIGCARRIR
jgi:hypothetical protein